MSQAEPGPLEEQVRKLAAADLSTRKIAELVSASQSTVVRVLKRADTGPQTALQEKRWSWRWPTADEIRVVTLAVTAVALLVLAAAVATMAWR